jgi:ribosomal protein S18 acetylase RimI-like enzyme
MRRLYVRAAFRRRGIGRRLVDALDAQGRRMGYARMRLVSLPFMEEAMALYRAAGFREVPAYRASRARDAIFMETRLGKGS